MICYQFIRKHLSGMFRIDNIEPPLQSYDIPILLKPDDLFSCRLEFRIQRFDD